MRSAQLTWEADILETHDLCSLLPLFGTRKSYLEGRIASQTNADEGILSPYVKMLGDFHST